MLIGQLEVRGLYQLGEVKTQEVGFEEVLKNVINVVFIVAVIEKKVERIGEIGVG